MRLVNETPFQVGYLSGRLGFPGYSLTVVVKGTFRLVNRGVAVPAEKPLPFIGDVPDEEEGPSSLRYPLDLVPFKPKADLLLVGKCHAGARPQARSRVVFTVGPFTKALDVFGDRVWKTDGTPSEPAPFTEMDLVYERSFGGPGWPSNPVGRGFVPQSRPQGPHASPLPNIEDPAHPLVDISRRPPPAGFGPLRRDWKSRSDKLGTYDAAWRNERWPWFPADFDFGHFNAAPVDMQSPYLKGNESLRFEHLHPTEPVFQSALPGVRLRCLVGTVAPGEGGAHLREAPMVIDTLWVDVETHTLVLVWRGAIDVASQYIEECVDHLFLSCEKVGDPPTPHETLAGRIVSALAPPAVAVPEPPFARPDTAKGDDDDEFERVMGEADQKTRAVLIEAGLDPDNLPLPTDEEKSAQAEHLKGLGFGDEEDAAPELPWTRERVAAAAAGRESLAGRDLSGLDLSELDLEGADLTEANLTDAKLCRSKAGKAKLDRAILQRTDLTGADLNASSFVEADLTEAKLERANLGQSTLEGAVAERAVFRECHLEGARAKGLSGRAADFTKAVCTDADFTGANLSECLMDGSDWQRAGLRGASMYTARGEGIDARKADLTGVRASEGAAFPRSHFGGVRADRSHWRGADLTGSDLSSATFERADFSGARLDAVRLVGADLKHAKFERASLRMAILTNANLFQANLERANLSGADLTGTNLYEAETWNAELAGAMLTGANVKGTKLAKASE